MTRAPRTPLLFGTVTALVLLTCCDRPARAQFCFGLGIGGFNYVPSPTDFVNQHSLLNAGRATRGPVSNNVYSGNPNSYINRVRDNGFVSHSDVRRFPPVTRPRRGGSTTRPAEPLAVAAVAPAPAPRPVLPLASFFDASFKLVWPAEAPVDGDLQGKRDRSDQSSLAVLDETRRYQAAALPTVTEARERLLDYGRPALQHIRSTATPRIADTFHLFLLSLYESLAQAAYPPEDAPGAP
jgi:hypothetical protein